MTLAHSVRSQPDRRPRERLVRALPWLLLAPAIALTFGLRVVPMLLAAGVSTTDMNLARPYDPVRFVGTDNYSALLRSSDFHDAVWTTIAILGPAVLLEMTLGVALAVWLAHPFRGRRLARGAMLAPYLLTPIVIGNYFRMFYSAEFGQLNYFLSLLGLGSGHQPWLTDPHTVRWAIVAMEVWHTTPFVALLCLAGLMSVPREPLEAALVDGATAWKRFRYVILPLLAPILIATLALRAMDALQLFDEVYVLTGGGPGHLSEVFNLYLYKEGFRQFQLGPTSAAAGFLVAAVGLLGLVAAQARRWHGRRA